jgi:glycosyltransferase involved in cell wall biosynthesis
MRVAVTLEQCWHRVPGGTAVAAVEVARAMLDEPDVEQIGVSARHRHAPPEVWAPPIPVRPLPLPRRALYESWHRLRAPRVQRASGLVDVVHATGVAVPPRSAPLVVTVHDLAWRHDESHFTAHGVRFFARALELARRDADLVLCSSTTTLHDCAEAGLPADRLRLVPLGVRAEPVSDAAVARVTAAHGLRRYVMWNGTVEPRKNLPTVIAAFRRVTDGRPPADLQLLLVGPDGWNEDVGRHLSGLDDQVVRLPLQTASDLAALHAGAAVFCYPSLREGFGLPVLEAMAQGTPVVTSAGTATEEVAGDAALVVDPADADAVAGAVASILDDAELAGRLSIAGRARAASYTWARTASATLAAYREVAP